MSTKKTPVKVKIADVKKYAKLQCTDAELAAFLGIRLHTLRSLKQKDERVRKAIEDGRALGRISLRRVQYRLATVNPSMAIHLGKVYLGQKDVTRHEHTGEDGGPIESIDVTNLSKAERGDLRRLLSRVTQKTPG